MPVKIILADDHAVIRDGLRLLLETRNECLVVASVSNGLEAVRAAKEHKPDAAVMDIAMPGLNGIEAAEAIRRDCPQTRVVILSMHATPEYVRRALQAGASGYVLKEAAGSEVVDAVRAVIAGRRYISALLRDSVLDHLLDGNTTGPLESLSGRERQVMQLVAEGRTSVEIARELHLSAKTVDTYRSRLMDKLELRNVADVVRFAVQHGVVTPEHV